MRISGFMHRVNNPELTKRLNEHVPKTMEEMMITTTAFIWGEAVAAGKKKGHRSWRTHDQSKRHASERRSDFRGQPREGRRSTKFTPLIRTAKEILATEAGKFKPPPLCSGIESPLVIEAEIGGHMIHRMYVDEGQLRLLVTIGDADHSTRAWMNFMIVRSLSPYNGIGVRHENFKVALHPNFPNQEVAIRGTLFAKDTENSDYSRAHGVHHENFKIAPHPNYPDQEVAIEGTLFAKGRTELCSLLKDFYPISEIDWKVESLCGYPFKCFLDAYKGYHQIQMAESAVRNKMLIPHRAKCISFIDQNAFRRSKSVRGALRTTLVYKAFNSQVSRNIEVYVDDLVIKSQTEAEMLRDIDETFRTLRKINMKLNPKICTFGAVEGMFLGYMISPEGIKSCPDKTEAVLQLPSPRTIKEVQSLIGKLASLNRFISKSAKRSLPLFITLKKCIKKSDFHWTPEAEQAYKQLKQHLSRRRTSLQATKATLVRATPAGGTQTEGGTNRIPDPELDYTPMEKLVLSLVFAAKRLRRYFQAHSIAFTASNNEAEYEALIAGLRITAQIGVRNVHVSVDSKLVANQVLGAYVAKEKNMIKYLEKVKSLVSGFANFSISQVPRSQNKKADALSKIVSTSFAHLSKQVLVEILKEKSIQEKEVTTVVEEDGPTWMTPIIEYLKEGTLPNDRKEASKLRIKARQYELLEEVLYRRSFLKPWLRCVGPLQADYVIRKIHEGSCSMHAGPRFVVAKAMRLGYYWPTMHRDTRDMIRTCNDCQIHHPVPRNPQQLLAPITASWLFYKSGIDIAGPFLEGPGKVKFLIVAMDNFTKWIKAKSVATITGNQFSDNPFKDWCEKLSITQRFASVKHPQSNGLVERANQSLVEGIKARLGQGNKNWIEELPHVLWAHRIMIKSSHGDTLFSLTYGTEAVIPAEIGMPTYRTMTVDATHNDAELRQNLDLLEERRERASIREAKAKLQMTKYYNARVRGVTFRLGDFVYRSNDISYAVAGGKLGPKWEGPYEVTKALGNGAYRLRSMDGTILPRTWNIANLEKCYL
ncbi:reverse transcriptase domain-containing protein [Tanacetum coccineum]|uniref:Reverse transcriptase domain-containing protein n=1 Tax=Tanacetum coccineum TaxID=301880 RepID=A0ABQ4XBG1_9ASTR